MAFKQTLRPPEQKTVQFKVTEFQGGLNNVTSPFELNMQESPSLKNVICFDKGSVETRPGSFKYILDQFSEEIKKIFTYEAGNFSYFMCSSSTKLYRIPTIGGTIAEVCTVSNAISGFQLEDKFYFIDGEKYRVYDGTDVYEIINPEYIIAQAQGGAESSITLANTSSADDDFYNGWTIYIYNGAGSLQSAIISDYVGNTKVATVSQPWGVQPLDSSQYYLTNHPQGDTYTDAINFKKMYVPTYDEFSASFKGPNNINDIKKCKSLLFHKTRVWFTKNPEHGNIVYSTEIGNPLYVPTNQYIAPVTSDANIIEGIFSFNDVLIIFKKNTIFALYGSSEDDYDLKELTVSCGVMNMDTIAKADNYLFYLGFNGTVYSLYDVRTDYRKILTKSISEQLNFNSQPIDLHDTDLSDSRAIYFDNHYFLSIKDKVLVYSRGSWVMWDNLNINTFLQYDNVLLFTNSRKYLYRLPLNRFYITETFTATENQTTFTVLKGYLNEIREDITIKKNNVVYDGAEKLSNIKFKLIPCAVGDQISIEYLSLLSYNDDGDSYESYWESKDIDFDFPSKTKQIRKLYITANTYKYFTSQIHFDIYVDYYELNTGFTMKNQIPLWGVSLFGEKFISKNVVDSKPIEINKRGKIIRFRVSSDQIDQPFKLYSIYGEVNIRK